MKKIFSFVLVLSFLLGFSLADAKGGGFSGGRSSGFGGSRSFSAPSRSYSAPTRTVSAPTRSVSPTYKPSTGRTSGFTSPTRPNTSVTRNVSSGGVTHNYYGGGFGGYGGGSGFFTGYLMGNMMHPWGYFGYGGYGGYGGIGGGYVDNGSYVAYPVVPISERILGGIIGLCFFFFTLITGFLVLRWMVRKMNDD